LNRKYRATTTQSASVRRIVAATSRQRVDLPAGTV